MIDFETIPKQELLKYVLSDTFNDGRRQAAADALAKSLVTTETTPDVGLQSRQSFRSHKRNTMRLCKKTRPRFTSLLSGNHAYNT